MKQALVLHAWYNNPKNNWYPWLRIELKKRDFSVYIPELPTLQTDLPDLAQILKFVTSNFELNRQTVVVGHSLGAVVAMRLAEKHSYAKMFLVAGWDYDDLYRQHILFWKTKMKHAQIRRHVKNVYVYSSDKDPYITTFQAEEMSKRLGGKFILVKGAGHFTDKDGITKIPELLKFL